MYFVLFSFLILTLIFLFENERVRKRASFQISKTFVYVRSIKSFLLILERQFITDFTFTFNSTLPFQTFTQNQFIILKSN